MSSNLQPGGPLHKTLAAKISFIPLMALLARASGGGVVKLPRWLAWLPEALFAGVIGWVSFELWGPWGLLGGPWSYLFMQTGHHQMLRGLFGWKKFKDDKKRNKLDYIIVPICKALRQPVGGFWYSWLFLSLKGLLIALPLGWYSLILMLLWPTAYYFGWKIDYPKHWRHRKNYAEWFSGAATGFTILLAGI